MAEWAAKGETPDILFWVGCAGSFDQRAQKITRAFATILDKAGVRYAILGKEEACTGDPARRLGNDLVFGSLAEDASDSVWRRALIRSSSTWVAISVRCVSTAAGS